MIWIGMIVAGILNFLSKFLSLNYFDASKMNPVIRKILAYVPSAIFPAIIFPSIFLDNNGLLDLQSNPKILAAILAVIVGYFSRSIIATIFVGLISYWFLIFVYYQ
jgi:branched-subunit amino acid transport protein